MWVIMLGFPGFITVKRGVTELMVLGPSWFTESDTVVVLVITLSSSLPGLVVGGGDLPITRLLAVSDI